MNSFSRTSIRLLPAVLFMTCSAALSSAHELRILPGDVDLNGAHATHQLSAVWLVQAGEIGARIQPERVTWKSADESIVKVEQERLHSVSDGTTTVSATALDEQGKPLATHSIQVHVQGTGQSIEPSFRNEVQSVLARLGCNSGACHGALAGKGGFRLSLRGYDADSDWFTITREAQGRRIELADPGSSLLLTKPTGAVAHKGGLRLEANSEDYRLIADWIARGAPGPKANDPRLTHLSVSPEQSTLAMGDTQRILVRAHYDDGSIVDVTRWAKFSASDEAVAAINEQGAVTVRGPGSGAFVAWFGSKVALSRVIVPYPFEVPEEKYTQSPRRNFIDELVLARLQQLRLEPGERCGDAEFIRRAMVDTIGRLPTAEEVRQFTSDPAPDRRDRLIESLLKRPEFVDYWTYKWSDLLLVSGTKLRPQGVQSFYKWIRTQVENNVPWDAFVREILVAQGNTNQNGATNFYAIHQDPETLTENACQAFLGLSIACAKCHNHPLEKWTNDQYYAMANLFARVRGKGWGGDSRNGDGLRVVYVASEGDLIQPRRGQPQPPTPLDGEALALDDPRDRRQHLAAWLTGPENPYFARSIANRIWANFFAVGLVEQVDDLRLSNPASNEPLLDEASRYLVEQKFDLKTLMRQILQSETYQRTSQPSPKNEPDQRFYSRYYPRRMMAEALLDGIDQVLETQSKFEFVAFPGADRQKTDFYPPGTRAMQLYDAAVESYFLKTFGRNSREITCECERSDEPSMVQVLHLANGETLNPKLATSGLIQRWIDSQVEDEAAVQQLFLAALSREPTDDERKKLLETLREYPAAERRQGLEDLCWSVLVTNEFVFNH